MPPRTWLPAAVGTLRRRAEAALWPVLQQTAAAAAAWLIALQVVDHAAPFFARIAAVIGLNATLGRRGSNAVRLLLGVFVGIIVGQEAVIGGGVGSLTPAVSPRCSSLSRLTVHASWSPRRRSARRVRRAVRRCLRRDAAHP